MPGIQTNLLNLGTSFKKFKAMEAAAIRRDAVIKELIQKYTRQGHDPYRAQLMAADHYGSIHKTTNNEK